MAKQGLPIGFELDPSIDPKDVFNEEYRHWTVGDLIGMLEEYDQDARVWVAPIEWPEDDHPVLVGPLELIYATHGEVFL